DDHDESGDSACKAKTAHATSIFHVLGNDYGSNYESYAKEKLYRRAKLSNVIGHFLSEGFHGTLLFLITYDIILKLFSILLWSLKVVIFRKKRSHSSSSFNETY